MRPALLLLSTLFIFASPAPPANNFIPGEHNLAFQKTAPSPDGNTIKGRVLTAARKPASNVLVFVIEGEEESLTNARGEFEIRTHKSFPFDVTAQELIGKRKRAKATAYSAEVTIEFR